MPTVLVVDDEQEILNFVDAALKRENYSVLVALNGDAAIEKFESATTPIDLLLTDVVMPGMSGPMLADRLLAVQPSLPVLFMSGYDDSQVVQRYVLKEGFALMPKPFNLDVLTAKVREMLPDPPAIGKSQIA